MSELDGLPPPLLLEVDGVCDDFERFWRRARRRGETLPHHEAFLGRVSEEGRAALRVALEELCRELLAEAEFPEVAGYRFLAEIARGPMGVVYRVRRDADGRELALKTLQSAGLILWSRNLCLLPEGEVLTELRHPHIVPVECFGEHQGLHYLVMPLAAGGDLRQRLNEFVLAEGGNSRIAGLMAKVAGAVAFLHSHGILHRDLKPSNILLSAMEAPEPLVCDFGLARRISRTNAVPHSREVVGTLAYMAPEQMEGVQALTAQADVWSLGAVLYELLTGRPPFNPDRQAGMEPPSPAEVNPAAIGELERICIRCLRPDPAARYSSAAELANELRLLS